jgi:hypothetical protein
MVIAGATLLSGCASSIAPEDLAEAPNETANPVGRVIAIEKHNSTTATAQGEPGIAAATAVGGVAGGLIAGALHGGNPSSRNATITIHTILLDSGEIVRHNSDYEFPVGTCVAIGPTATKYVSIVARSQRCKAGLP